MKAIICAKYGSPDVLRLTDVERPMPRPHEVLIKVYATTVTASDCIVRGFKVPVAMWLPMALAVGFPAPRQPILGMEFAGEVESVGKEVGAFRKGDRVFGFDRFGFGCHAEYKRISASGLVAPKPVTLSDEDAAAIPFGGLLALSFLRRGRLQNGQRVLIYGASGSIGSSAVQLAKHFGAAVTGVCSTRNVERVLSLGADAVIDYTKEDFVTRGERFDLILNAVGKAKARLRCERALNPGGKHVTIDDGSPSVSREDLILLKQLAESGALRPVVDRRYALEEVPEAHRYVETGHKRGSVIIRVAQVAGHHPFG